MKSIAVGILGTELAGWGGGVDLLRTIVSALALKAGQAPIVPVLFLPRNRPDLIESFGGILGTSPIRIIPVEHALDVARELNAHSAAVLLPILNPLPQGIPWSWIGYIYDFQHKYYPQFFSVEEIGRRDKIFARLANEPPALIVNSQAVKDDIDRFLPGHRGQIFVMPFASAALAEKFDEPGENLAEKYKLPTRYFIISNQFWVHKSHETAFEALALLRREPSCADIAIVCTGHRGDRRFPGYFDQLLSRVGRLGLADSIFTLGHIPKDEQIHLMMNAIAVLQPTLFEGGRGGGSVSHAVALGVPAIVSDIAVNRELNERNVFFFRTGSSEDLAARMAELALRPRARPGREQLLAESHQRLARLGDCLLEVVDYASGMYRRRAQMEKVGWES